jgi:hypothetical protein
MKGILERINEAPVVDYDPTKGVTIEDLAEQAIKLHQMPKRKPEYLLSKWEAENLPMWQLEWLGENNIVLVSLEVQNIIKERSEKTKQ